MILESGMIVFLGLLLLAVKLPKKMLLRLLGVPLLFDLSVSAIAYALHWGTFSGVMAAAVAGLLTSGFTSGGRWLIGYIRAGVYHAGVFPMDVGK
jgi:hypothetical protein